MCIRDRVKAGSGALTGGAPDSAGVPAELAGDTLTAQYNDLASVRRLLDANPGQVAAIIVEPVAANMGVVPPQPGFLQGLRTLCDETVSYTHLCVHRCTFWFLQAFAWLLFTGNGLAAVGGKAAARLPTERCV